MTHLPMFPLGAVLFPSMPLALRVFEQRYLEMLAAVLQDEPPEFGVVLIERGQEVGGGDARFGIGTVARVSELNAGEGFIAVLGVGVRRIEIVEWLDEAPYPVAEVREMAPLEWTEEHREQLDATERAVRSALAVASEFADLSWSADVEIATEPVAAAWQLAAIAPLGAMDQVALLGATTIPQLLDGIREGTESALDQLRFAALDDEAPGDE
ncbi:MAG: LON peptidase substrate-binding domain-containing protein [Microbacteriaceae bacterium]